MCSKIIKNCTATKVTKHKTIQMDVFHISNRIAYNNIPYTYIPVCYLVEDIVCSNARHHNVNVITNKTKNKA